MHPCTHARKYTYTCTHTLSLSSWLVSRAQERYHVSLFFSFASRSYFSRVLLSTCPVRYLWRGGRREREGEGGRGEREGGGKKMEEGQRAHEESEFSVASTYMQVQCQNHIHVCTYITCPPIVDLPASTMIQKGGTCTCTCRQTHVNTCIYYFHV